jgi:hypothetical protein
MQGLPARNGRFADGWNARKGMSIDEPGQFSTEAGGPRMGQRKAGDPVPWQMTGKSLGKMVGETGSNLRPSAPKEDKITVFCGF